MAMTGRNTIARAIIAARAHAGLSQAELAKRTLRRPRLSRG
jgi:ribosome-binding protein aMBF1 (putative translation factor)